MIVRSSSSFSVGSHYDWVAWVLAPAGVPSLCARINSMTLLLPVLRPRRICLLIAQSRQELIPEILVALIHFCVFS